MKNRKLVDWKHFHVVRRSHDRIVLIVNVVAIIGVFFLAAIVLL